MFVLPPELNVSWTLSVLMLELQESETSFSLLTENTATCIDELTSASLYLPAASQPIRSNRLTAHNSRVREFL